ALLSQATASGWVLAAGMIGVAAMMIASITADPLEDGDPGTTSVIALMVCFSLGAIIWYGYASIAVMLAIATTVLLYFKAQLHGITLKLTSTDILSILQFGVLSMVVLPILPNKNFGPYGALNPQQIWWMVVLISGVSLAGYTALRLVGARHGATLIGLFGGLASSTATTMIFARHARAHLNLDRTAMVVILIANIVVMVRLGLVSFVVAPAVIVPLSIVLGSGILLGFIATIWGWRQLDRNETLPMPEVSNPTEIKTALTFGALYAVILVLSSWLQDIAGNSGLYLVALASGLTDVDAIVLSSLRLFGLAKLSAAETVTAIALATLANLTFKTGLVIAIGGASLSRRTLPGLAAIAIGLIGGLWLSRWYVG
ncbi:MAG TPA: DUF4010 domain-containing protein, partial [Rhodocyclaceae bacterium]|nr:DUF4010 domain-containing protein [Rhodocyclaceae bacterium]